MPVIVKKLAEEDARAVQDIAIASWNFTYNGIYDSEYIEKWLKDHYGLEGIERDIKKSLNDEGLLFLGAFENSLCAGFIEYKFSGSEADLLRLYLTPEKIGCGYGKALLQEGESLLIKNGIKRCSLEVNCRNSRAISFYKNFGFKIADVNDNDYTMIKEYSIS